jgi:F-type H+-transporting ATPase subunit delta
MTNAAAPQQPDVSGTVLEAKSHGLARTYAEALLGAAAKEGTTESVLDDLDALVREVWRARPQFAALMASPSINTHDKDRILTETFEGRLEPTLLKFLRVLNRHGRLEFLEAIAQQARAQWERKQNRRRVLVRSAVPLDEGQTATLRDRLASLLKATPLLTVEVDPSLIGGLVVQVGDFVYDASVKNRFLGSLRRRLIEEKVHEFRALRDRIAVP